MFHCLPLYINTANKVTQEQLFVYWNIKIHLNDVRCVDFQPLLLSLSRQVNVDVASIV